jgi:F-type H+-transporting ATPase subunit alpha
MKLDLARFRELAAFAQFASDLDKATQAQLARGQRLTELLKQPQYQPMPVDQQVISIYAVTNGYMDAFDVSAVSRFERDLLAFIAQRYPEIVSSIRSEKAISKDVEETLKGALSEFASHFDPNAPEGGASSAAAQNSVASTISANGATGDATAEREAVAAV